MTDFIVKAVPIDGMNWPIRAMLQSLDSPELGDTEWWRRMAMLQNAAARAGDSMLLSVLDVKKETRWGTTFEAPELITTNNNLPPLSIEETIKRWFQNLSEDKRLNFLKESIASLLEVTDTRGKNKIFSKKQHWMGVYIVLRDRLGINVKRNDFHNYAANITPDTCLSKLKITASTMTNFSKAVPDEKYFEMKTNPFHDICTMFWTIIKSLYYNKISTNK